LFESEAENYVPLFHPEGLLVNLMLDCIESVQKLRDLLEDAEISHVEKTKYNEMTEHICNLTERIQSKATYHTPALRSLVDIPTELRRSVLRKVSLFPEDKSKLKLLTNICQSCLNIVKKVIERYQQPKNDKLLPMIVAYPDFIVLQLAIVEQLLSERGTSEKTTEFIKALTKFHGNVH
jgi:hypothetical protein